VPVSPRSLVVSRGKRTNPRVRRIRRYLYRDFSLEAQRRARQAEGVTAGEESVDAHV